MTEGNQALGAAARVDALDVLETHERFCAALRQLEQLLRLHQAEAQRAWPADSGMTARDVAAAWISVNELLAHAVARLRKVETTMTAQLDAVLNALREAEET
jgi:hypothetical protein